MLDQAATNCGTLVTGQGLPTLTMTVNYLRVGRGSLFVVTARMLSVTRTSAVLGSDLADEQGRPIASASVVAHLRDITRVRVNRAHRLSAAAQRPHRWFPIAAGVGSGEPTEVGEAPAVCDRSHRDG